MAAVNVMARNVKVDMEMAVDNVGAKGERHLTVRVNGGSLRINTDRDGKEYRFHARLDRNPDGDISMYYGGLQWRPYGQSTFYVDEEIHWRDQEMPEHKDKDMGHRLLEVLAIMYGYKLKKEVA